MADTKTNMATFNGGKMVHIWEISRETRAYDPSLTTPEAQEALMHGVMYNKIDGSNGMLFVDDGEDGVKTLTLYRRHDMRDKWSEEKDGLPVGHVHLPDGKNPSVYSKHRYLYELVDPTVKSKKLGKIHRALYAIMEAHRDTLVELCGERGHASVELVGTKFNKTPAVPHTVGIAPHALQIIRPDAKIERTFEGMRAWLMAQRIEGVVIEHQNKFWKIRTDCFDKSVKIDFQNPVTHPVFFSL